MIAIFGVLCLFVSKGDKSMVKRYNRIPNEDFSFQLNTISYWSCDWCACAEVQLIFHYGSTADKTPRYMLHASMQLLAKMDLCPVFLQATLHNVTSAMLFAA